MDPDILLPYEPELDFDSEVTIPAANFEIEVGGQPDGLVLVRITTRPAGTFTLADTAPGRPGGPQQIQVKFPGTTPAEIHAAMQSVAAVVAERVADQSGIPWSPPLRVRLKRWWEQVRNHNTSQT